MDKHKISIQKFYEISKMVERYKCLEELNRGKLTNAVEASFSSLDTEIKSMLYLFNLDKILPEDLKDEIQDKLRVHFANEQYKLKNELLTKYNIDVDKEEEYEY